MPVKVTEYLKKIPIGYFLKDIFKLNKHNTYWKRCWNNVKFPKMDLQIQWNPDQNWNNIFFEHDMLIHMFIW